jgi:hypothetical protein
MVGVKILFGVLIEEYRRGIFKGNPVFFEVLRRLSVVPGKSYLSYNYTILLSAL